MTQEVDDTDNKGGPNESNAESKHLDLDVASGTKESESEQKSGVEQPVLPNPKQPVQRRTSLKLRRLPTDILLKPGSSPASSVAESQTEELEVKSSGSRLPCLNPTFGLRTQLLLAFGSVSVFIIAFVSIVSVIIAWNSGENLKSINEAAFEDIVSRIEGNSARYLAESFTPTLIPDDVVRILYESARDCFAGYPKEDDEFVPFFDIDSQTNKYPVVGAAGKPLPFDWQLDANVNNDNHEEHVQGRWSWYDAEPAVSTANAFYVMQGMCDPSVTDPSAFTFLENCTDANNDVSTGGVITPSPKNNHLYRKSSSLSPILKAVFESHPHIRELGIFFSNGGAGSGFQFPHYQLQTGISYTSIGCEWMKQPNPYDPSRPIGTKEEIARCRPEGTVVSVRLYNNLERGWCRDQALNPFKPIVDGPYLDAWKNQLVITAGQGIYDRVTNDFIGCIYVGWYLEDLEEIVAASRVTQNSVVSVARFDDGTIAASTVWDSSTANYTLKVYELNIGLTFESYEELKTLVDYNETWDPTDVREKYEGFILRNVGFVVSIYPMPPVPESYDPNYIPLFFAMLSAPEDIFQVVEDVKENVDDHMERVIYISLIVGAIGLVVVLFIIYLMSKALTAPLEYMNAAADEIINHFGSTNSSMNKTERKTLTLGYHWFPRTELNDVVKEFDKMVTSFSGSFASAAKSVKSGREDIPNRFNMQNDFDTLYESRKETNFGYKVGSVDGGLADTTQFINLGSNIKFNVYNGIEKPSSAVWDDKQSTGSFTSRLFFWTVLLIGIPLLLTTIAISAIVMYNMAAEFHDSIESVESFYLAVELNALSVHAFLRADVVSSGTSKPTRDLHLLSRYTSWLLFGGVERAVSFTQVKTGAEQCKTFPVVEDCPFYDENYFCDCAWDDPGHACNNYTFDTRPFQDLYFVCEASDTFPNGDRNSTSFPNVSYSPESTIWWDDVRKLPGSEKGGLASGYETTYDRLRAISASPIYQLFYNLDIGKEYTAGTHIAFEADGLFMSFDGCTDMLLKTAKWSSTEANGAFKFRPELCPLGKYGYDPRCRGWYDTGKRLAEIDGTPLHITSPYVYADASKIGQSATSPLIDPKTTEQIGQVMIDFISGPILDVLDDKNTPLAGGGFPILITTLSKADSVIAPGFSLLNETAKPIAQLVLPHDQICNEADCKLRKSDFKRTVLSMKRGESGKTRFTRLSSTGSVEALYIAYAPVVLKGYRTLDSSDFSRGVEAREVSIYSLALVETERGLLKAFEQIEEETDMKIRVSIVVLSVIIFVCILYAIYIMGVVTLSVSGPMLVLLDVIHSINRRDVNEAPPIVNRSNGSRELINVSDTIQTLYKVVRCGNYAFFSGDLEKAYAVLYDASRLFHHLDNKRAIGVVSNNLGNLLLVVFRVMEEADEEHCCGMTKTEVINKGISCFHESIKLGEMAYDEFYKVEGWSPNCVDFMQHLSNRYFNRGMFLLTVKNGTSKPDEIEKLGFRDLVIARDMDREVANTGLEVGWGHSTSVLKKFDVALVRAKGHVVSQELGYPDNWEVGKMLDSAFMMVKEEIEKDPYSSLFQTITAAGRLQEIESELIRYKLLKGEVRLAAQIGIRMLVEDEFISPEAQEKALEALSVYVDQSMEVDEDTKVNLHCGLATCQTTLQGVIDETDKSRMSMLPENEESIVNITAMKLSIGDSDYAQFISRRSTIRESCRGYLTMEDF